MKSCLVDVFANGPLSGNGLTIFELDTPLTGEQMLALTREMRQFESILCNPRSKSTERAHFYL